MRVDGSSCLLQFGMIRQVGIAFPDLPAWLKRYGL